MAKNPQSRDDALEALDFIVNVLKEHEKDLDKLITELATVTEQLGDTGELSGKVAKVEEKINGLQKEVTTLIGYVSRVPKENLVVPAKPQPTLTAPAPAVGSAMVHAGPALLLRCIEWDDFQKLASKAQTVSFTYKEDEKVFQADALKGNQIITYSGALPKLSFVLKGWLSRQLEVAEQNILEGTLTIR